MGQVSKRKRVVVKSFAPRVKNEDLLLTLNEDKGYMWNMPSHISGKKKTGWEFMTKTKKRSRKKCNNKQQTILSSSALSATKRVIQTPEDLLRAIGVKFKPHLLKCIHKALRQPVHELSHVHRNHVSQLAGPAVEVVLQSFAGQHWFVFVRVLVLRYTHPLVCNTHVILYVCAHVLLGDRCCTTLVTTSTCTTAAAAAAPQTATPR